MISRRQIISGSTGPIFAIFSPNESVLGADDTSVPSGLFARLCQEVMFDVQMTHRNKQKLLNVA